MATTCSRLTVRAAAACFVVLALAGCDNAPTPQSDPSVAEKGADAASNRNRRDGCARTMRTILDGLAFDRIGGDVDVDTKTADLNAWRRKCVTEEVGLADDGSDRSRLLPAEFAEMAVGDRYSLRDVRHIRAALFSSAVADALDATDDVGRAVEAMQLTADHLAYLDPQLGFLGVPLPQMWLMGVANPSERAYAFIELLRQMSLDAAILDMPAAAGFPAYQLVAVVIDDEAYLFDPQLGMPVPAPSDDAALPTVPLTLSDGKRNDDVFRALDQPGRKYPVSSLRLKTARVAVSVTPSLLADRMAVVQNELPLDVNAVLYQGLDENAFSEKGLLRRVAEGLGVDESSIQVWGFPLALTGEMLPRTDAITQLNTQREQVLRGPFSLLGFREVEGGPPEPVILSSSSEDDAVKRQVEESADEERRKEDEARRLAEIEAEREARQAAGERVADEEFIRNRDDDVSSGRRALVKTLGQGRAFLLAGRTEDAFRTFLRSRLAEFEYPLNAIGRADAEYWVAISQMKQGKSDVAARGFARFISGKIQSLWPAAARRAYGVLLADQGEYERAVEVVDSLEVSDPSLAFLSDRWRRLGGLTTAGETAKESPESDDADGAKPAAAESEGESPEMKADESPASEMKADETEAAEEAGGDEESPNRAEASEAQTQRKKARAARPTRDAGAES